MEEGMKQEYKEEVIKIIVELSKQEGSVIPLAQIERLAKDKGLSEEDINNALTELAGDGELSRIDEESVEFNMSKTN
ncbi:hypothetical protein ACFL0W_06555 [Nanoarchaeota archaeon]